MRPIKDGRNQGRRMASFTLEDQTSSVRVVAFADAFEKAERFLTDGGALLVTATLRCQDAEHVELGLEEVVPLEGIEARRAAAVRVEIDLARHGSEAALELSRAHPESRGQGLARLRLLETGGALSWCPAACWSQPR